MFSALASFFSTKAYQLAYKNIIKHMNKAGLRLRIELINGDIIEYWDNHSDKPVALLIHGFGASTEYQWYKQVEFLSRNYRVITPNLFYFGKSIPGSPKFKIKDQVELIDSLVNHLDLNSLTLFGVSYGGLISMEYAQMYNKKVERLVVFDAPVKYVFTEDITTVCKRFKVDSVEDLFVPKTPKELKRLLYLVLGKKSIIPSFMLRSFYENVYGENHDDKRFLMTSLIASLDEYAQHNYDFNTPTLLIWGSNDMAIPVDRAHLIRDHIGENAELQIIENGAHMPNITKTKKFNGIVSAFLAQK